MTIAIAAVLHCDCTTCDVTVGVVVDVFGGIAKPPPGWILSRFQPGMLENTKRRPDTHFCSPECLLKATGRKKAP